MKSIKYTRWYVTIVTTIITAVLFAIIYHTNTNVSVAYTNIDESDVEVPKVTIYDIPEDIIEEYILPIENVWEVEIPIINLIGPINSRNYTSNNGCICRTF